MGNPVLGSRRTSIEIINQILSVCNNGGANKTAVMYRSNLSYDQLRRYLELLEGQRLLSRTVKGKFRTTSKGTGTLKQTSSLLRGLANLHLDMAPTNGKRGAKAG